MRGFGWLSAVTWSRAAPYIVLALIASHAVAYGTGSWQGYEKSEAVMLRQISVRQAERLKKDRAIQAQDAKVGQREEIIRYKIIRETAAVPVGQCVFSADCLQYYRTLVRAADTAGQAAGD